MAVDVTGENALKWTAGIDLNNFDDGIKAIIGGLQKTAKAANDAAKAQNDAFTGAGSGINAASEAAKKMQAVFDGFTSAKDKVVELQKELLKIKAPGFADGKTPAQLDNLQKYIAQTEKDLTTMQGIAADYAQQLVNLSKIKIEAPAVATPNIAPVTNAISSQVIDELKKSFGEIDEPTQKFIADLIDLELKLQNLRLAEKDLADSFNAGKITQQQYAETSKFLVAGIHDIGQQTEKLVIGQKAYEASLKGSNGSIAEKKQALQALVTQYEALSTAQRKSPEGLDLAVKVKALKTEIKGLNSDTLNQVHGSLATVRTELLKLQDQMTRNPESPLFETWKKEAIALRKEMIVTKKEINEGINPTPGVEAFVEGLRGLVGTFEAGTGIIGLFTTDTEEYEKVTKNAASALALMNGIQEVANVLSKTGGLNIYLQGLFRKQNTIATVAETAALEANTIVEGTNAAAAEANAVATEVQAVATESATVATNGFTAAMLANPAAVIVAAIVALAAAYLLLSSNSSKAKEEQEALADINKKAADSSAEEVVSLKLLVAEYQNTATSIRRKKEIQEELQSTYPNYFANLKTEKEFQNGIAEAADKATKALFLQAKIQASTQILGEKYKDLLKKQFDPESAISGIDKIKAYAVAALGPGSLGTAQGVLAVGSIKGVEKAKEEFESFRNFIEKGVAADNQALDQLGGDPHKKVTEAAKKEAKEIKGLNELLSERKSILEKIDALNRDAKQSGLVKEASEVDKINEKYDEAIKKITDYNTKVEAFNKKNPANKVQLIQGSAIQTINQDRATEIQNQQFKTQAENYKKHLDDEQKIFQDYEAAKLAIGVAKADELFSAQTKGATSYLDYLKKQKAEIDKTVAIGPNEDLNLGQILKSQQLAKEIDAEIAKQNKAAIDKQIEDYKTLLQATVTYQEQKAALNKKYNDLEARLELDTTISVPVKTEKLAILEDEKKRELSNAQATAFEKTDIYKKMNDGILQLTRARLFDELEAAKKILAQGSTTDSLGNVISISDEQRNKILEYIKKLEDAETATRTLFGLTADELKHISTSIGDVSQTFNQLAQSVRGTNDDLANTLDTMGALAGIAGNAVGAVGSFLAGDIIGGVTKTISAIGGLFTLGAKSRESARK
ncbi:MAG: hypothetical protein ABIU77_27750, partial [Ferruginibacter sp.]